MGRTPLLRALRTLFAEHRVARQLGVPVEALRERRARAAEERARRGLTRRQFLIGTGAAAALVARPRGARAAAGPTIAIVGGGIAGLACALELADRGIAATVYEASGRVGGRMFSNTGGHWDAGQVTAWGGELIDSGHRIDRRLARRFNLKLDDLLGAQPNGSDDVYRFFGHYYPKSQADADFSAIFDAIVADEAAAPFPSTWDSHTADGELLDSMSVFDYIEDRVPGGHTSPARPAPRHARPVHDVRRLRGGAPGRRALCRRAHIHRLPWLHGGRRRAGPAGGRGAGGSHLGADPTVRALPRTERG